MTGSNYDGFNEMNVAVAASTRRSLRLVLVASSAFWSCSEPVPCDETGSSAPRVTVQEAFETCNHRPVAFIAGPRTAHKRTLSLLDGSRSTDADGDELNFGWRLTGRPEASAAAVESGLPTTSLNTDLPGTYQVELVVSDGLADSAPAALLIEVTNREPVAHAVAAEYVDAGTEIILDGRGSRDPDGDELSFQWTIAQAPFGSAASLQGAQSSEARLLADQRGHFEFSLQVSDGEAYGEPVTVKVRAGVSASPPVADAGLAGTSTVGEVVFLSGAGSYDADGDPLAFEWRILTAPLEALATLTSSRTPETTLTPDRPGVWIIELTVDDGFYRASATVDLQVIRSSVLLGPAVFDPARVYVLGGFAEGGDTDRLLCDPEAREFGPSAGLAPYDFTGQIRDIDGAYIYLTSDQGGGSRLLRFVPEPLRWDSDVEIWRFPPTPKENDLELPTPACPGGASAFLLSPATSELSYFCGDLGRWFDQAGDEFPGCITNGGLLDSPIGRGFDGSTLCLTSIRNAAGDSFPLGGHQKTTWRARPAGGFWSIGYDSVLERNIRFVLHPDGSTEVDLTYGPTPAGRPAPDQLARFTALDRAGRFYAKSGRALLRYPADGSEAEVLYEESPEQHCYLDTMSMVTGP
jgi:hypothetical protein